MSDTTKASTNGLTSAVITGMRRRSAIGLLLLVAIASALALALPAVASAEDFGLTIATEGTGSGTIKCDVGSGPEECKAKYAEGTEIKFVAIPGKGSEFYEWGEDCLGAGDECEVTMDTDKVVSAVFELIEVPLELQTEGLGFGEIECKVEGGPAEGCEFEYPFGTKIAFVAVAEPGSVFVEWDEDCSGAGACEVTMDEEHFVSAVFGLKVALNIELEGFGEGEVECEVEGGPAEACETEYLEGTKVKLVPVAETGSKFVEWTEECSGNGACELTVDEERFVGAVFEPIEEFELEVTVTGEGKVDANSGAIANCRESSGTCSDEYVEGTKVILTATPDSANKFEGWTGCDSEPSGKCEVTMSAVKSVEAEFAEIPLEEFELEVIKSGTGTGKVTSSPAGIDCGSTCSAEYVKGTKVTLTASANAGSVFVKWEGCKAEPSPTQCEVTIGEDEEVKAIFELLRTLTITKAGTGGGEVKCKVNGGSAGTCASSYANGTKLELVATASAGSEFKGFSSGTGSAVSCSTSPCAFKIEANSSVTAKFDLEPPSEFGLTVALAGTGTGTVTSSPAGINCGIDCSDAYAAGTEVTLTATPASGSSFAGWSGACSGTGGCKVTMNQARSVTATFTKSSSPPPPPPPPGTAVVGRTAKVKAGKAALKLTCKGEGACKGSLKLKAKVKSGGKTKNLVIGKASFSLAAGATTTLKVKLSGPAKTALAKGPLKAKVSGSGVAASTVKLKPAKK